MAAAADLGLWPVREGQYTVVFRCTLAESRTLTERAGEIGLAPQLERGKVISFRATVEEHALLVEAGKRVGLSATGFAAIAALEGAQIELKHRRRRRRVKDFEVLRQMVVEMQLATNQVSRAGGLLNQAVTSSTSKAGRPRHWRRPLNRSSRRWRLRTGWCLSWARRSGRR